MRFIIEGQKKSAYFDNSKPWYLLGIVSYGTKICGAGSPAVYTRCMIWKGKVNLRNIKLSLHGPSASSQAVSAGGCYGMN